MSLFGNILEKLGLKKKEEVKQTPAKAPTATPTKPVKPQTLYNAPQAVSGPVVSKPLVVPMSEVNVVAKLDGLAKANPEKLNWKVSIVDLLKLLDLDSSLDSRKQLATELGCPPEKMGGDHAQMNMWLHKEVMKKIAANGGNIPKDMLD